MSKIVLGIPTNKLPIYEFVKNVVFKMKLLFCFLKGEFLMADSDDGPSRNSCLAALYMFGLTFKATVGTGILAIPYVVSRFGVMGAVAGLAAFAALSWYTMRVLLVCVNTIASMEAPEKFEELIQQPLLDDKGKCCVQQYFNTITIYVLFFRSVGSLENFNL